MPWFRLLFRFNLSTWLEIWLRKVAVGGFALKKAARTDSGWNLSFWLAWRHSLISVHTHFGQSKIWNAKRNHLDARFWSRLQKQDHLKKDWSIIQWRHCLVFCYFKTMTSFKIDQSQFQIRLPTLSVYFPPPPSLFDSILSELKSGGIGGQHFWKLFLPKVFLLFLLTHWLPLLTWTKGLDGVYLVNL